MASVLVSGTEGYAEQAEALLKQYESIAFAHVHRHVLHLIPRVPGLVLDIGSGTGRDAAGFAAMGHRVVAVEPTAAFRVEAAAMHRSDRIEWLDDSLPELVLLRRRGQRFDAVMLTAVSMHLDAGQRRRAMPVVAGLAHAGGIVVFSLRHGPVPPGRRMFAVSAPETIGLAKAEGLRLVLRLDRQPGAFGREEVSWTGLAFANGRQGGEPEVGSAPSERRSA